ncbi:MAG: menaquinone biosynthesis protein [Planctomycetes bacterium]|nr:menaquinone biosynthesis protein [Planctomycetota bacterium]
MGNRVRIGAVEYLNTKPLIRGLEQHLPDGGLVLDRPSALADMLRAGKLDVALIPSIEYLRNPGYQMIPDTCIASRGQVMSVILICRRPAAHIAKVALDTSSRSSVALCRIILSRTCTAAPEFVNWSTDTPLEEVDADAILVIGDKAMRLRSDHEHIMDLGEEWQRLTGLPFVYAVWAGRHITPQARAMLRRAKEEGTQHLAEIASQESERLGIPPGVCLDYITNRIRYDFGPAEQEGLGLFRRYAAEKGLCPGADEREDLALKQN